MQHHVLHQLLQISLLRGTLTLFVNFHLHLDDSESVVALFSLSLQCF